MQPSANVEMQLLLCKHCSKHHVNKQQNDSIKISQKECNDSTINTKLVPSTLTSTRKKQTKNNNIINNPSNIIDNIGIDQHRKTTTVNDGANALNTFGAMQSILSSRNNNQIADDSLNQLHCHENCRQKTSMNQQTKHINPQLSRYYDNNREEQLMIECSENAVAIERLTSNQFKTNPNDNINNDNNNYFNRRIMSQKGSFYTFCTNQSDICFSSIKDNSNTNDNNRPKSHVHTEPAHLSRRTSSTLSSSSSSTTMKYSHVLLLCLSFFAFGMRSALVLADETPANSENALNTSTETGSK